jgi:coenzyme F420-0:L-glutamate ligase / coenzyme F420-1:gamma-L-glutamate ligase
MTTKAKLGPAIDQRRSIRRYLSGPIDELVIERILVAATQAPSAHNRQPWRFVVLDDRAGKVKLATAMGQRLRRDRTADGDDPQAIEDDVAQSYARITEAPVVIVVCLDNRDMDRYPDDQRNTAEYLMAVQSTAMAVQNLLLAAHGEGLGACVMCAPLFCPGSVSDGLGLPSEWKAQMLVTIGTPANAGRTRPRLPLATVVRWPRRTEGPGSAR